MKVLENSQKNMEDKACGSFSEQLLSNKNKKGNHIVVDDEEQGAPPSDEEEELKIAFDPHAEKMEKFQS